MLNTTHYNLGKPADTENYDVGVPNANMDTIDAALWALNGSTDTRLDAAEATLTALGYSAWADFAATLRSGVTVVANTSITYARVSRLGKTVRYKGQANTGATAVTNATILLPSAVGFVPLRRELALGTLVIIGATPPAQTGTARMTAAKDGLVCLVDSGAFADMPANHTLIWDVTYEVA